ncbi:MAG: hypothetical protein GEU75_09120 [Dehalococcoidia bacterium]|nr:hypothetical protein [Dehalococcoidia bacterium]
MAIEVKQRKNLTSDLIRDLKQQFAGIGRKDLSAYTFERHSTHYPDARADISIFDAEGDLVIVGREYSGGRAMLWFATTALVDKR